MKRVQRRERATLKECKMKKVLKTKVQYGKSLKKLNIKRTWKLKEIAIH